MEMDQEQQRNATDTPKKSGEREREKRGENNNCTGQAGTNATSVRSLA